MKNIEDLLWHPWSNLPGTGSEMDPLAESDALQEAQLLDVRVHALSSTVGLLFELRTALQFREGNAAVLVAHDVRALTWLAEPRPTPLTAWTVISSEPKPDDGIFNLRLEFWPHSQLDLTAAAADFYIINVPDLDEAPPDYSDNDGTIIRTKLPGWDYSFSPVHAVHFDPSRTTG
jgi:hypothetical protein